MFPEISQAPADAVAGEVFDSRAWLSVVKGGSVLSLARGGVLLLQLGQYFVLATLLAPAGFGQVSLFSIILLYGSLVGFGTDYIAVRETPGRLAVNDRARFETLRDVTFTYELALRLICGSVVAIAGLLFFDRTLRTGLLIIAAILVFDKAQNIYYGLGSAMKKFDVLSRASLLSGVLMAALTLGLVRTAGVYTQLLAVLVSGIVTTVFYSRRLALKPRLRFDFAAFAPALKMGLPFVGMSWTFYLWKAADRTLIAGFLSKEMLGQYSFAALSVQVITNFMNDFQTAFMPAIYERTAIARGPHDIYRIVRKPSLVLAYVTPAVIAGVWVCYQIAVRLVMPEYNGSVWVFRVLAGQLYLGNIAMMAVYILRSPEVNGQAQLVWAYVAAAVINYALVFASIRMGIGLPGVAAGTLAAQAAAVAITFAFAHKHYLPRSKDAAFYYLELILPFVCLMLCFVAVYWIETTPAIADSWRLACSGGLVALFVGVALVALEWRVGLFSGMMRLRQREAPIPSN